MTKKDKKAKEELKAGSNKFDVLIRLIDRTYDLLNSGNIIGIIAVIILLVIWKLPPDDLGKRVDVALGIISSERYYFFPMTVLLIFSISINVYQRKVYKLEIKRLADVRKALMHGLTSKEMKPLEKHYPSKYDIEEK